MIRRKVKINKKNKKEAQREKIATIFLSLVLTFAIIVLFFTAKSIFLPSEKSNQQIQQPEMQASTSSMSLTPYDKELARQMMDKDGDGKCDVCGMDVNVCIESGQMQCNMDSQSTIGVLGSQHIHTDWKIYINGELLDFTGKDHMTGMTSGSSVSSFIHVDSGAPAPEKTGDILHMHAKGVSLWIFFESIEIKLPDEMKVYVNGKEILDYENYVFEDLDKILITDGKGDLQEQLNSITDFAKVH